VEFTKLFELNTVKTRVRSLWCKSPTRATAASFVRFLAHILHTTVGMTRLDEGSARGRDLYLTIHNSHKRHTSMPPDVFEPATPANDRPQNLASDRSATGIGVCTQYWALKKKTPFSKKKKKQHFMHVNFNIRKIVSSLLTVSQKSPW
jgi:hypothetical protein